MIAPRTVFGWIAAPLMIGACGCMSFYPTSVNESGEVFRGVPVPLEATAFLHPGGAEKVATQSYTLTPDGQFTFHRSFEKEAGTIGAGLGPLHPDAAARLQRPPFSGVLVRNVVRNGPAARAGLHPDDVIVEYAGEAVTSHELLAFTIAESAPGSTVPLSVARENTVVTTTITLGAERRIVSGTAIQRKLRMAYDLDRTGLVFAEMTPEVRAIIFGPATPPHGLLVTEVWPGGPGFHADLQVRDLVVKADEQWLATLEDFGRTIGAAEAGSEVTVTIRRDAREFEAPLHVGANVRVGSGFNLLNLVKFRSRPETTEFSLIFDLLCKYRSCNSVKRADTSTRNVTQSGWSTILSLIVWRNTHGGKKELRLGWFFPIAWGGD